MPLTSATTSRASIPAFFTCFRPQIGSIAGVAVGQDSAPVVTLVCVRLHVAEAGQVSPKRAIYKGVAGTSACQVGLGKVSDRVE